MTNNIETLQRKHQKFNWWAFIYVLIVLFCFYPYEFYSVYLTFLPEVTYVRSIISLIFTFVLLIIGKSNTYIIRFVSVVFFMQLLGFFITGVAHMNFLPAIEKSVNMLLALSLVLFVSNRIGLVQFFKKYNCWILIMAILGCITFFMVELMDFQPLYVIPDRADGRPIFNYLLTFSKSDEFSIGITRYAGFFDEPGAMAYWGIYALVINRLFIKNKWIEIILGISLLFTLSIGYFIQYAAFLLLFNVGRKNKVQTIISTIIIFAVIGWVYMTKNTANNVIYEYSLGRIENMFTESRESSNSIAVGDRAVYTENALNEFKENPLFGSPRTDSEIGNNVYETLAMYGIIGSFFIQIPFILLIILGIKYKDLTLLKCSIVVILGFTHRPFHTNILSFFIIYCIVVMYKQLRIRKKSASLVNVNNS